MEYRDAVHSSEGVPTGEVLHLLPVAQQQCFANGSGVLSGLFQWASGGHWTVTFPYFCSDTKVRVLFKHFGGLEALFFKHEAAENPVIHTQLPIF